jgi:hypothetical protein
MAEVADEVIPQPAQVLAYQPPPRPPERREPSPLVAALLCLPGAVCFAILMAIVTSRFTGMNPFRSIGPVFILACWGLAFVTAAASVGHYWRRSKPWYVALCLMVNVAGLVFTCCLVAFVVIISMAATV